MSGGDGLFEVDPAGVVKPETAPTVAAKKSFRVFVPDQMLKRRRSWTGRGR
ncbi:hypothetical protein AB0942_35790 [Streptomyces nodosus]|uniref:hypothetical protein n=1 Tax=Streptomyces nodosus TaxID=40318 RepID=UPI0034540559